MSRVELPDRRLLNPAFKGHRRPDVVMIDIFRINDGEILKLTFESTNSSWRQGVWLKTDEYMLVDQKRCPSIELWADTAPTEVLIECHTRKGTLHLYNIWDSGRGLGMESQCMTSGMLVEDISNGRRYRCNDIGSEPGFDKLVFRIERLL